MNDTISYKIHDAYMLPYEVAINRDAMKFHESNNEIIASSRIYLICRLKKKFISSTISRPEVLYVGETFNKDTRFSGHEHILKATTMINTRWNPLQREYIGVYFLHIRFSFTGFTLFNNNPWDLFQEIKDIDSKTSVQLLERLYIKLFKPVLNSMHNNDRIKEDNLILRKLLNNDIKFIHLDIGMNETEFQFYSNNIDQSEDWYNYDLLKEKIIPGYIDTFPKQAKAH